MRCLWHEIHGLVLGGGGDVRPRNGDDRNGGHDHGGGDGDHDGWENLLLRSQPVPHSLCAQHLFRRRSIQALMDSDADSDADADGEGGGECEGEGEAALRSLRHPLRAGQAVASERAYRPDTAHRSKSVSV